MDNIKRLVLIIALLCIIATGAAMVSLGGIDADWLQATLKQAGIWGPIIYIVIYTVATVLVLPSTVLNLAGGALFGPWLGSLWTTIGALVAAMVAFGFTRTIGRELVEKRLAGYWQTLDAEIRHGGLFYMFSIRLLPVIPYGLVNFAAGLTSISWKDYVLGTALGTLPGVLPFVLLGSSGLTLSQTGDLLPLVVALTLIGLLVGGATWYRRRRALPKALTKEHSEPPENRQ
ncbi:TVP38/TMEM64 family protein [Leptolyngbya cf. ectocarpi LEGE 11479]|uniref:TVP38/TMEM64 family membrane protein n=1 Tax=Leptolyngbya cf. ectocarpi LEGE 11479 TaxID=1828722 RepID=A0A928WYV3_LEPEC|nr:TVP38/TMEM64 family protein [Leptolyngbya ectocarpi]MBE9065372.1 TVP38/TMEM64 family protein [Leptolyngbya cf. ectocarpi LEGE 11479]